MGARRRGFSARSRPKVLVEAALVGVRGEFRFKGRLLLCSALCVRQLLGIGSKVKCRKRARAYRYTYTAAWLAVVAIGCAVVVVVDVAKCSGGCENVRGCGRVFVLYSLKLN